MDLLVVSTSKITSSINLPDRLKVIFGERTFVLAKNLIDKQLFLLHDSVAPFHKGIDFLFGIYLFLVNLNQFSHYQKNLLGNNCLVIFIYY